LPEQNSGLRQGGGTSFDEVVVVQFLASANQRTLPLVMLLRDVT